MVFHLSLFLGNILLPPIQTVTKEKQIDKDFGIDRYRRHRIHKLCLQSLHITLLFGNCHSRNGFLRNRQFNSTQHTNNKNKLLHIILVFLTMGIVIFIAHENGYIIMDTNNYNNYILFFIGSFAGICMINLSSNFLSLKPVFQNIIIYISKNTLIINSFHLLTFSFLKGIMVFVFHIPVEPLYGKIVPNIVFALVSLFSCLPIAYIINKHFPFIIGKKRSPEG